MNQKKAVVAILIGNILEKYSTALYVFSTVFLAQYFFPVEHKIVGFFGTFASGFLIRPIGGLIFGHIGDRMGRKMALIIAISCVTVPSFIVGFLPGYHTIGVAASILLILCRVLQGISASGEYSGAAVMISEKFCGRRKGFMSGLLPATSIFGLFLGACVVGVSSISSMPFWAWRVPFILAGIVGLVGLYLRLQLDESPVFEDVRARAMTRKLPIWDLVRHDLWAFLCMLIMAATASVTFYLPMVYVSDFMLPDVISKATRMGINALCMGTMILCMPLAGHISDRWGRIPVMSLSLGLFILLVIPMFWVLSQATALPIIILCYILMGLFSAGYVGPTVAFQASLFPPSERYSGMAFGASLGEAIFGGLAPLICLWLASSINLYVGPALYLIFCALSTLILIYSIYLAQKKQFRPAFG